MKYLPTQNNFDQTYSDLIGNSSELDKVLWKVKNLKLHDPILNNHSN